MPVCNMMNNGITQDKILGRAKAVYDFHLSSEFQNRTIFLLEYEAELLASLTRALANSGLSVSTSQLAEHALAVITSSHPVDLVIVDTGLPRTDSAEFCNRAALLRPGIPLIVITGGGSIIDLSRFPPNTTVIYKPFRRQDVMEMIETKLAQSARTTMS